MSMVICCSGDRRMADSMIFSQRGGYEMLEVYSEKLDATIIVSDEATDNEMNFAEADSTSLVGWTHGDWNNSGGGGSW